jgi:hypothetical protein
MSKLAMVAVSSRFTHAGLEDDRAQRLREAGVIADHLCWRRARTLRSVAPATINRTSGICGPSVPVWVCVDGIVAIAELLAASNPRRLL